MVAVLLQHVNLGFNLLFLLLRRGKPECPYLGNDGETLPNVGVKMQLTAKYG